MKYEDQALIPIEVTDLLAKTDAFRKDGYRLVQIGCTKIDEKFEINYSFDKDFAFKTLRITVQQDAVIPSVSGIYWGAFVYENEIHDLYGLTVTGMNVDFKGTFYRTTVKYPFSSFVAKEDNPCQNK